VFFKQLNYPNKIIKELPAKRLIMIVAAVTLLLILLFNTYACKRETDGTLNSESISEDMQGKYAFRYSKSLKAGDYIQLGSYQVEGEGYNPILWVVIDSNGHYAEYVTPEVEHITLLSAYIIDLRGFDSIEPENTNELRRGYGNGRYITSNIRQWLNSSGDEDNWWIARKLAAEAIRVIKDKRAVGPLTEALKDRIYDVVEAARKALKNINKWGILSS